MSGIIRTSSEFDSLEKLIRDLTMHLPGDETEESQLAILFCDSQVDCQAVLSGVQAVIRIPVVGGTALGFPLTNDDGGEISACLLLVGKPGLKVSVAVSDPLDPAKHDQQMQAVVNHCRKKLGEEARLLMPFFPLMPGVNMDGFINDLFLLADGLPVYGGTTTNDLVSTRAAVFADGKAYFDRMVLVALGGDVRPVFATANSVTNMSEYMPVVTRANGNTVHEVDGEPFCNYMRKLGLNPEDRINGVDALMQYGPTPVEMHVPGRTEDDVPEVRCISFTNVDEGSATFSGAMPEGTRFSMSILRKEDVDASARNCLEVLQERMRTVEAQGYSFSAMLCISCVARYFVLVGNENSERSHLMANQIPGVPLAGYYAFCEIGPTLASDDGRLLNRSHSASIAMCAF